MPAQKGLSQEEIWDDSALLQSWDEALNEYKGSKTFIDGKIQLYHSIHARGETVDDSSEVVETRDADEPKEHMTQEGREDQETEVGNVTSGSQQGARRKAQTNMAAQHSQVSAPDLPQELAGGVQDLSLKNLMMSWYWAGYYTGLNEGLNQAKQKTGKQAERGGNTG